MAITVRDVPRRATAGLAGERGPVLVCALLALAGVSAGAGRASAQTTVSMHGPAGSSLNWNTASNWTPGVVPNNTGRQKYVAVIGPTSAGAFLSGPVVVTGFSLNGTPGGSPASFDLDAFGFTVNDSLQMSQGFVVSNGTGTSVVISNGTISIEGGVADEVEICDTDINHQGKLFTWSGGNVLLDNGSNVNIGSNSVVNIGSGAGVLTGAFGLRGVDPAQLVNAGFLVIDRLDQPEGSPVLIEMTELVNENGVVIARRGSLSTDGVTLTPGPETLTGSWIVENPGGLSLNDTNSLPLIVRTIGGLVALDGPLASFPAIQAPFGGENSGVNTIDPSGELTLEAGAALATEAGLDTNGPLRIDSSNGATTLHVLGVLNQFDAADMIEGSAFDTTVDADLGYRVRSTGRLRGDGKIIGALTNNGSIAPGRPLGSLDVTGTYTQTGAGAEFVATLLASESGGFSHMTVTGAASLSGTLRVVLRPGFVAVAGTTYDIITSGSRSGTFGTLVLPPLPHPTLTVSFTVSYTASPGRVRLTVPGSVSGGACCLPEGTCIYTATAAHCSGLAGVYQGDFTACATGLCPQPVGACCKPNGECAIVDSALCATLGGDYQGDGSVCHGGAPTYTVERSSDNFLGTVDHSGEPLTLGDDGSAVIPIGFAFEHFGVVHTEVRVSANGYLTFGTAGGAAFNTVIPSAASPNDLIAPLWSDWNQTIPSGAEIDYQTIGAPGSRELVVQWTQIPEYGSSDSNTFQVRLREADGAVEFRYGEFTPAAPAGDYSVGIENPTGTAGVSVSAADIVEGDSIVILPSSVLCPPPIGACCFADRTCSQIDRDACTGSGGHFEGALTVCTSLSCCASEEEALVDTRTDSDGDTSAVVLNGVIAANEYGPGNTQVYLGDGRGFGGDIGPGALYMDRDAGTLYVALAAAGALNPGDDAVVMLDTRAGGLTDAQMSDTADGGRRVASNLARDAEDAFPPGFAPDFALVMGTSFSALYELQTGALTFVASPPSAQVGNTRELAIPLFLLGAGTDIDFLVGYCSESNFLSSECIPAQSFSAGTNPGFGIAGSFVDWCHFDRFSTATAVTVCVTAGDEDNFAVAGEPEDALTIRPDFASFLGRPGGTNAVNHMGQPLAFDNPNPNNWAFGYSFTGLPALSSATLRIGLRAGTMGAGNDGLSLEYHGSPGCSRFRYDGFINVLEGLAGGNGVWSAGESRVFTLDLGALPMDVCTATTKSLIADMATNGYLDVYVQNATGVDFIELCYSTNQPATGACCLDRCTCEVMSQTDCVNAGGVYQADGAACDELGCLPNIACPCDWNGADGLDSQDYFDFLTAFFEGGADFNCDAAADSQDYFDFIACFFGGCG